MFYDELSHKPVGYSYRVDDNIWAGEYPVWEWSQGARIAQLNLFLDFGINYFLDLTEDGEMPPYEEFLPKGIVRHCFSIPNYGTPPDCEHIMELFRCVSELIRSKPNLRLYIHCVGGVGRTGTIVACYYVYFKGMTAAEALDEMRHRYATHGRSAWSSAPETEAQVDFVKEFEMTCRSNGN